MKPRVMHIVAERLPVLQSDHDDAINIFLLLFIGGENGSGKVV